MTSLKQHPYRWTVTLLFALLAFVAAVGASIGRWTHTTLFDTEAWLEVVGPISSDEEISDALTEVVSTELIDFLDPTGRLEALLPPLLAPVAAELGGQVETIIVEETDAFFHSELYDELWLTVNETAHSAAVAIIRDQLPFVSTAEGVVSVDLESMVTPILDNLADRLQLLGESVPQVILDQVDIDETMSSLIAQYETEGLPESLSNVVVYESDRLAAVQQAIATFDRLVVVLPFIALLLAGIAVAVSPSRLIMILIILFGFALSWFTAMLIVDLIVGSLVGGIESSNAAAVAETILLGITKALDDLLRILIVAALLVGVASVLVVLRRRRREQTGT